jgi:Spy/CpxP family protein refolding chaperone
MKLVRLALAVALVAILTASASAQEKKRPGGGGFGGGGFGGGMGALQLLGQKSVQEELKVTEEQTKKVTEYQEKQRANRPAGGGGGGNFDPEAFRARMEERRKADDKFLGETLKPEQRKRLDQIVLQQTEKTSGLSGALRDEKNQTALKLNDDQKELLKAIGDDQRKLMGELFQGGGGGGNFEENQKKLADFRKTANEKIAKTLTEDQKKTWKEMLGAEFTGKIEQPTRRRPGGGGN